MKCVLDTSVALKWVLFEADTPKADTLRNEFRSGLHDFIAPDIFPVEAAHGLTKAERRLLIPQASLLLGDILTTLPTLHASLPLLARAVDIASQARLGVYDCLYVALAERESCDFLTADLRLLNSLKLPYIIGF